MSSNILIPMPLLNRRHTLLCKASLSCVGGLLLLAGAINTAWAAQDLSDLSTRERLERLEAITDNTGAMADMVTQMNTLQSDLQRMQGELELQAHEIEQLKNSQRQINDDVGRRVGNIEQNSTAPSPASSILLPVPDDSLSSDSAAPATSGNADPALGTSLNSEDLPGIEDESVPGLSADSGANSPAADSGAQQAAYQSAFSALKSSQYDKAISGFKSFLAAYPNADDSDNAQYWLGETYYVKRDFKSAGRAFQNLLDNYPQSPKRADATLKLGFVAYESGKWSSARSNLKKVLADFPDSSAAQLANARLQKMDKEGH